METRGRTSADDTLSGVSIGDKRRVLTVFIFIPIVLLSSRVQEPQNQDQHTRECPPRSTHPVPILVLVALRVGAAIHPLAGAEAQSDHHGLQVCRELELLPVLGLGKVAEGKDQLKVVVAFTYLGILVGKVGQNKDVLLLIASNVL